MKHVSKKKKKSEDLKTSKWVNLSAIQVYGNVKFLHKPVCPQKQPEKRTETDGVFALLASVSVKRVKSTRRGENRGNAYWGMSLLAYS